MREIVVFVRRKEVLRLQLGQDLKLRGLGGFIKKKKKLERGLQEEGGQNKFFSTEF